MDEHRRYPSVVAIVGPTAVGKSRLALELAQRFDADILSADSRQVYRYMDIGTAKPTPQERARVRHFMIDLVAPDEPYSAQRFQSEGLRVLERIRARGRLALVVGGTGFYVRSLLDALPLPAVPPNPELRERLRAEAREGGAARLHRRLSAADPESGRRIHPNNIPRLIRALEVVEHLGGPVPRQGRAAGQPEGTRSADPAPVIPALYIGLDMERTRLHAVADARAAAQVQAGLANETRLLLEMGYRPELPALEGFGYRQMVSYLRGAMTLEEALAAYQAATRQYIRRQMTWFRADERITWLAAGEAAASRASELIASWIATASSVRS